MLGLKSKRSYTPTVNHQVGIKHLSPQGQPDCRLTDWYRINDEQRRIRSRMTESEARSLRYASLTPLTIDRSTG